MPENKKSKILFFALLLTFLLGANFVFALEINYPPVPGADTPQVILEKARSGKIPSEEIISYYVQYFVNLIIWAAGIIAFGALVIGGIRYLISTGKPESIVGAREQISGAFLGLLILLSSWLILKTLSPQFVISEIPKLEPIAEIEIPETSPPPTEEFRSTIETEVPLGKLIEEGIFEGTAPWKEEKRVPRIKKIASDILASADNLKKQNEDLKKDTDKCECKDTDPKPPCRWRSSATCKLPLPCTCDPCEDARESIKRNQEKNKEEIDKLISYQVKTEKESRLLKEEIGKLERAEKFMAECPLDSLTSLSEFGEKKNYYLANGWLLNGAKFWEKIKAGSDWATFYCPVSGTFWEGNTPEASPTEAEILEEVFLLENSGIEIILACSIEIPVGEIIDRTKRIAWKITEKLENLIKLSEQMIKSVNEIHILVSQCSSQRCKSNCRWDPGGIFSSGKCRHRDCRGEPCKKGEIEQKLKEIQEIQKQIKEVIEGKEKEGEETSPAPAFSAADKEEKIENIGIMPIINDLIPGLLIDLETKIRQPMKKCVKNSFISSCPASLGTIGPEGKLLLNYCFEEDWFQNCLGLCYLEKGQSPYRKCLKDCLEEKTQETGIEEMTTCRHLFNFFCCSYQ